MPKGKAQDETIIITKVEEGTFNAVLVGRTPLILNRLSEKTKQELIFPKGRKTAADKASGLKHNVFEEFRSSAHVVPAGDTLLAFPAAGPKKAIASAALDIPGAKKAQIGRLCWVPGEYLSVFGTPKLMMSSVRTADMNHTPDMRTRCVVTEWVMPLSVRYVVPIINPTVIANLLSAAGMYIGLGDWRNEKGGSNFGQFDVLSRAAAERDARVTRIMKIGRAEQLQAMERPEYYDLETERNVTWFVEEVKRRGKSVAGLPDAPEPVEAIA